MEDMNMEINAAAFYGMYGEKGGGRRGSSMTALMTEQEEEQEHKQEQCPPAATCCEDMMTMTIPAFPRRSSFSSYSSHGGHVEAAALLSAAAMFHGGQDPTSSGHNHHYHHSKHLVGGHFQDGQLAMNEQAAVISNSSLSSPKMEASSNHMEFDRKVAQGGRGRPCWPEPSLVVRSVTLSRSQEAMVTPLEIMESATSTNPKEAGNAMKTKIAGHPLYPRLLAAYLDCQKIGAPPEVVSVLDEMSEEKQHERHSPTISIGADPELDQFMEAYCEMLRKQQVELDKPYKEGMAFINKIETQLNSLNIGVVRNFSPGYPYDRDGRCASSEEELSCGEVEANEVDPGAQDKELKDQLLRKYSGYFSTLKKEFLKKRKKGKLPKEGRQKLLDWWNLHYKWPYPSETDKVALAESTGLDQKQINNWFINQRKRHWKPSEDMQIMVMDTFNPHTASFFIHETEG